MQTKHVLIVMGALGLMGVSYYFLFMRDGSPVAAGSNITGSSTGTGTKAPPSGGKTTTGKTISLSASASDSSGKTTNFAIGDTVTIPPETANWKIRKIYDGKEAQLKRGLITVTEPLSKLKKV